MTIVKNKVNNENNLCGVSTVKESAKSSNYVTLQKQNNSAHCVSGLFPLLPSALVPCSAEELDWSADKSLCSPSSKLALTSAFGDYKTHQCNQIETGAVQHQLQYNTLTLCISF